MQSVFEMQMRDTDPHKALEHNIAQHGGDDAVDAKFARTLLDGILKHGDDIRRSIQEHAPQWPLERMDVITRSILLMGGEELLFTGDAPPAVVMNEAIEVAKEFGTEEGAKFVNGVLNALAHAKKKSNPPPAA
jgi:N utilization substance protein B